MKLEINLRRTESGRKFLWYANKTLYIVCFPLMVVPAIILTAISDLLLYIPNAAAATAMSIKIENMMARTITVGMGTDVDTFLKMSKEEARKKLNTITPEKFAEIIGAKNKPNS